MKTLTDAYAAGRAAVRGQNEDTRRGEFLRAIDAGEANCTDFEINFIEGFLGDRALKPSDLDFQWFTPGRRKVVDNMIHRYGFRSLKMEANAVAALKLKAPAPGTCGYLKRDEDNRRNQPCGAPAVIKLRHGLELCNECNQVREQGLAHLRAAKEQRLRY